MAEALAINIKQMKTIRILVIEDDLRALEVLMGKLNTLEDKLYKQDYDIAVTVVSEYKEVEDYINNRQKDDFDIILLDRDSKEAGSFHVLDLGKFDKDKIISISGDLSYNQQMEARGVKKICQKDFEKLDEWGDKVIFWIENMIFFKKINT
jgi:DNA-binding NarL/FixJ family response regulator